MASKKVRFEIRNKDGKVSKGNEWAVDLAGRIGQECAEHGKGFIFAPWGGSNTNCKSFFATNHQDPMIFGAGMSMIISNYIKENPNFKSEREIIKWVGGVMATALEIYQQDMEDEAER